MLDHVGAEDSPDTLWGAFAQKREKVTLIGLVPFAANNARELRV
jgi:hypothetical protein